MKKKLDPMEELQRARLDGELDSAGERLLAEAESRDPALAAESADLRRLVEQLGELPEEIDPLRDLLPEIRSRLPRETSTRPLTWVLAATLVAALGVAFFAGRWTRLEEASPVVAQLPPTVAAVEAGSRVGVSAASSSLARTRLELRRAFDARRDDLPPETLALVEANLATIERAMAEIEAAIAVDPSDRDLGRLLVAYQTREIALLEQAQRAAARL